MRYIVARLPNGELHIMERRHLGEVEVYESVATAHTSEQAGAIADGLNKRLSEGVN